MTMEQEQTARAILEATRSGNREAYKKAKAQYLETEEAGAFQREHDAIVAAEANAAQAAATSAVKAKALFEISQKAEREAPLIDSEITRWGGKVQSWKNVYYQTRAAAEEFVGGSLEASDFGQMIEHQIMVRAKLAGAPQRNIIHDPNAEPAEAVFRQGIAAILGEVRRRCRQVPRLGKAAKDAGL